MTVPKFTMIVAHDNNRQIGFENKLPWIMPSDMQHFRRMTAGKSLLMGRLTAESIGRPLPGRTNLVMTTADRAPYEGQYPVTSLEQARQYAGLEELICIGGGQLYRQLMPFADEIYVTKIDTVLFQADTRFPMIDPKQFDLIDVSDWSQGPQDQYPMQLQTYRRRT